MQGPPPEPAGQPPRPPVAPPDVKGVPEGSTSKARPVGPRAPGHSKAVSPLKRSKRPSTGLWREAVFKVFCAIGFFAASKITYKQFLTQKTGFLSKVYLINRGLS